MDLYELVKAIGPDQILALRKLKPDLILRMVKDYERGLTTPQLSTKFNLSKATVCRGLRYAGITPQRTDGHFKKRVIDSILRQRIQKEYVNGARVYELADKYKIHHNRISSLLKRRKLRTPNSAHFNHDSYFHETREVNGRRILGWTDQKRLCVQYVKGSTLAKLSTEWKIALPTVKRTLKRNRIAAKKTIPNDVMAKICEEYSRGVCTTYDLANIYGISVTVVKYWLMKRGFDPHTREYSKMSNVTQLPSAAPGVSAGKMRKRMRELSARYADALEELIERPDVEPKDLISASKIVFDRAWGRPKEEPEEEEHHLSGKDKVLQLVHPELKNKLFNNGGEKKE